ncbi:hypothetical protein PTQ21_01180 [Paenibacillus marchantiae]|uniref:hypothetical protein n=1 Tax=Paenibacillus marchantiae TaxID=3026433 RepID=UPI00237AE077|nr:hypothetical protein [Paenibacillus marchantiae]WDQ32988.1 hypothetical protein PTQ21_01180 [Paenibacillus marchantiae]
MSNMHRIHWFDEQIRSGRFPNSSWLAREFEISRRQAQRDIEYMAISLRAPLVNIAKYRGLQHLFISEWEELLSPSWLRRKLQQSAESIIDRLAVQHKANVN